MTQEVTREVVTGAAPAGSLPRALHLSPLLKHSSPEIAARAVSEMDLLKHRVIPLRTGDLVKGHGRSLVLEIQPGS